MKPCTVHLRCDASCIDREPGTTLAEMPVHGILVSSPAGDRLISYKKPIQLGLAVSIARRNNPLVSLTGYLTEERETSRGERYRSIIPLERTDSFPYRIVTRTTRI